MNVSVDGTSIRRDVAATAVSSIRPGMSRTECRDRWRLGLIPIFLSACTYNNTYYRNVDVYHVGYLPPLNDVILE